MYPLNKDRRTAFSVLRRMYEGVGLTIPERIVIYFRSWLSSFNVLSTFVPESGRILDAGCGFGMLSIYLAVLSSGRLVRGVDISKRRIDIANKASRGIPNLVFDNVDILKVSFVGYHCILIIDSLHYFAKPIQNDLLGKCYRELNTGGVLILRDINKDYKSRYLLSAAHEKIMTTSGFTEGEWLCYRSFSKLRELLSGYGFSVKRVIPMWGKTPYADTLIVCRK